MSNVLPCIDLFRQWIVFIEYYTENLEYYMKEFTHKNLFEQKRNLITLALFSVDGIFVRVSLWNYLLNLKIQLIPLKRNSFICVNNKSIYLRQLAYNRIDYRSNSQSKAITQRQTMRCVLYVIRISVLNQS